MISVDQALHIINREVAPETIVKKKVVECFGYVLAEDVISKINMPPFRQSSMDGYAIKLSAENSYKIVGESKAGNTEIKKLEKNQAVRVFTLAMVPKDADVVVMQEHIRKQGGHIEILKKPTQNENIRPIGIQQKKDKIALPKKTFLSEAALGFLAGLGIETVSVYKKPRVTILITGDEFQTLGNPLGKGQIYESNSIVLEQALRRFGIQAIQIDFVEDNLQATIEAIRKGLQNSDLLLISGGISVGEYDFVKRALKANDVNEKFHGINQKPGKPLWFGTKNTKIVFALQGNPASSLTCFYVYVLPILVKITGNDKLPLKKARALLGLKINNPHHKTLFLKGAVENGIAKPLLGQASSILKSFALSNALLIVPAENPCIGKGQPITYLSLEQ